MAACSMGGVAKKCKANPYSMFLCKESKRLTAKFKKENKTWDIKKYSALLKKEYYKSKYYKGPAKTVATKKRPAAKRPAAKRPAAKKRKPTKK